ncbi:glutamyl-tRNA reductase [Natrialba sp. INN-245]|uniref:glutamyl-tRNA reductase n=1 Tax=Natrialba sp. INN-245 TaxID=2690967 RepID=UPI001313A4E4|nr:glutamyl-tRNA reductase [Natrialba sp. INN-245]
MIHAGVVTGARVTHDSACVDELAAASPESQRVGVERLLSVPDVEEAYVLSTCNRVEAYVVSPDAAVGRATLEEFFEGVDDDAVVHTDHDDSLRHLLRVATGLESVIVGEDQIIGQVRTAYEDARSADGIGSVLETGVTKAIHVGERARTETEINDGVVSLGSAATRLAAEDGALDGATALVVGAGEMGRLAARSLADANVGELVVANRTASHAAHLIGDLAVDADAVPLEALSTVVGDADVVVTATNSTDPILGPTHFEPGGVGPDEPEAETANGGGPTDTVIVDLGQPRDVSPAADELSTVTVYDLDDLESITEETREQRADAADEVERMIDHEFDLLRDQFKRARADEVIAAMYESAERIKARELQTALSRLEGEEFTPEQREVVESMADALVNQLLAPPTKSLREAAAEDDWSTISTALQLFDPEFGDDNSATLFSTADGTEPRIGAADDD